MPPAHTQKVKERKITSTCSPQCATVFFNTRDLAGLTHLAHKQKNHAPPSTGLSSRTSPVQRRRDRLLAQRRHCALRLLTRHPSALPHRPLPAGTMVPSGPTLGAVVLLGRLGSRV